MNAFSVAYVRRAAAFAFTLLVAVACQSSAPQWSDDPRPSLKNIPFVRHISGHPGFYIYTREPMAGYLDLRELRPGTVFRSGYSGIYYRVPLDHVRQSKPAINNGDQRTNPKNQPKNPQ